MDDHDSSPTLSAYSGRSRISDSYLLDGPVAKTLVSFSLPLLTTNLLNSISGTWSAVWVSQVEGPNALTAVANSNVFIFMMMGAVMSLGAAAGIAIGQAKGAEDPVAVKRIAGSSITFVAAISVLLAIAGVLAAPTILHAMRMPLEAESAALVFLRMGCVSMPPMFLLVAMMMMMRGSGDARTPFRISLVWVGSGMALTPVLLLGWFGLPRLGVFGVGLAGVLASVIALLALVAYVYWRGHPFAFRGAELAYFKPDAEIVRALALRGAPMAGEMIIVQGAYFVLLSLVNAHGAATASAYAAAAQLWGYVQMPSMALAASMSAMAAIAIGAGRWERVELLALRGTAVGAGMTAAMALLVYLLGDWPLLLFLPKGGEALETARHINVLVLWGWTALSVTSGLSAIVRANAAMLPPTLIYLTTMWVLRVPFASGLQGWLGADAIWLSFPMGAIASALLAYGYYRWGRWRENERFIPARPPA